MYIRSLIPSFLAPQAMQSHSIHLLSTLQQYSHQTCDILINLVDEVQHERNSWRTVAGETALLTVRCVQEAAHLGGDILVGERSHIRVTVKYTIQAAGGDNDSATVLNDAERPVDGRCAVCKEERRQTFFFIPRIGEN